MIAAPCARAARPQALTREQRRLLRWLQARLVREARTTAGARLDVVVRLTPEMARHLERWFQRHGWPAAQVRAAREGTHTLAPGDEQAPATLAAPARAGEPPGPRPTRAPGRSPGAP